MKLNELLFRFALFYLNLFGLTGTFQKTFSGFFGICSFSAVQEINT